MKNFIQGMKKLLPNVLLAMFIMILVSVLFGKECAVVGFILLFFQLMSKGTPFSTTKFIRSAIIMEFVTLLATLAELNTGLLILFSFVVPFFIVILTSDDYTPKGYFIYGLTYFLIQTGGATSYFALCKNMAALLLGLFIIFIYDYIQYKKQEKGQNQALLAQGFQILLEQGKQMLEGQQSSKTVFNVTHPFNAILYKSIHEKTGILSEQETKYFQTILFLEKMETLLKQLYQEPDFKIEKNKEYVKECMNLLKEFMKNQENPLELVQKIDKFLEEYHLTNIELNEDFRYTLKKLKHIVRGYPELQKEKITIQEYLHIQWIHLKNNLSFHTTQTRFAVRLSLTILIATIVAHIVSITTGFSRSYWLPITAYSLMLQFSEEETRKIKNYFIGTVIGVIVFTVIFQFVPEKATLPFMILAVTVLFLMQSEILRAVVGSQLALVFTSSAVGTLETIVARVILVLIAGIFTYIIDRMVLRTNKLHLIHNQVAHLLKMDRRLLKELKRAIFSHNIEFRYLDELILESCLTETLILNQEKDLKDSKEKDLTLEVLTYNREFILNVEQLITMFNTNAHLTYENYKQVVMQIDEMDHILEMTQLEWLHKNKGKPDETILKNKLEVKDETQYIENRLKDCIHNIENIHSHLTKENNKESKKALLQSE